MPPDKRSLLTRIGWVATICSCQQRDKSLLFFLPFLLGRVLASHYGAISYLTVSQKNISRKENYQFILSELVLEDSGTTVSSISG